MDQETIKKKRVDFSNTFDKLLVSRELTPPIYNTLFEKLKIARKMNVEHDVDLNELFN